MVFISVPFTVKASCLPFNALSPLAVPKIIHSVARLVSVATLEKELDKGNLNETEHSDLEDEINTQKLELEKINEDHTNGAILRSKRRWSPGWYNEGEKNTKYFLVFL